MDYFDLVYLATIPIYLLSVHFLFLTKLSTKQQARSMIIYALFGIALSLTHLLLELPLATFVVNISFFYILSTFYSTSIFERYSSILHILVIILVIETIFGVIVGQTEITLLENNDFQSILGLVLLRVTLCSVTFQLYKIHKSKNNGYPVPDYYYLSFTCIMVSLLFLYIIAVTRPNLSEYFIFLCSISILLTVFLLFYLEEKAYKMYEYYIENAILKEQTSAFDNQQELIKQSMHSTKSLKHDMKNQILVLLTLVEQRDFEKITSHSQQMLDDIDSKKALATSGHFVVDSLINYKLSIAEEITTNISLQVCEDLPILAYDLTVILGNLLDNAVTAVNQMSDEKVINILLDCDRGNFVLVIENSYHGKVHYEDCRYHSTKPFSLNHGYGLKNVENSVNKYHGTMDLEHGSSRFTATIIIPI